jgi:hypothetical protein
VADELPSKLPGSAALRRDFETLDGTEEVLAIQRSAVVYPTRRYGENSKAVLAKQEPTQ